MLAEVIPHRAAALLQGSFILSLHWPSRKLSAVFHNMNQFLPLIVPLLGCCPIVLVNNALQRNANVILNGIE